MKPNFAATILRWGLAFVFFYAAIATLLYPESWVNYLPPLLTRVFPSRWLLSGFAIYGLVLAGWLFWGKKVAWAAAFAAITLLAITLVNLNALDITFCDIGLAMAALALFDLSRQKNFSEEEIDR